jgi:hypothetical protein
MWVVAIGALYAGIVHLALHERTVDVHFVQDLAVRVVESLR